jgi:hypothetical protein
MVKNCLKSISFDYFCHPFIFIVEELPREKANALENISTSTLQRKVMRFSPDDLKFLTSF